MRQSITGVMMVGNLLRSHRKRLGLTQEDLAYRTGLSARHLRDLEAGRICQPRPSTLRLLSEAFGLGDERELSECRPEPEDPVAHHPAGDRLIPAQLPLDVGGFAGRRAELAQLNMLLSSDHPRPTVCVLAGPAGVGKTSLAVHWAHRARRHFPDGQLYVDLHGFGPGDDVVDPAEAVGCFLSALGVPRAQQPADPDARSALYRSLLADTRTLVVLDNVHDAAQVRSLLPGSDSCLTIVTSRRRLTGLVAREGAHPVAVDPLSTAEARELLAHRLGSDQLAAEPWAVDAVIDFCAGLPLALVVVAGKAATKAQRPLQEVMEELGAQPSTLDRLTAGEISTDVRAAFASSYRRLSSPAARLFRLLAQHPGPDISVPVAAGLLREDAAAASRLLDELVDIHLLVSHSGGRYGLHPLLRVFAQEPAQHHR